MLSRRVKVGFISMIYEKGAVSALKLIEGTLEGEIVSILGEANTTLVGVAADKAGNKTQSPKTGTPGDPNNSKGTSPSSSPNQGQGGNTMDNGGSFGAIKVPSDDKKANNGNNSNSGKSQGSSKNKSNSASKSGGASSSNGSTNIPSYNPKSETFE